MSQEIERNPARISDRTPPIAVPLGKNMIHTVEVFPDGGGWKDTIKCLKRGKGNCQGDYQFTNPGGGINHRRMGDFRRRMGI